MAVLRRFSFDDSTTSESVQLITRFNDVQGLEKINVFHLLLNMTPCRNNYNTAVKNSHTCLVMDGAYH